MSGKKRATSTASNADHRMTKGSYQTLAENFLARLDCTWQQHGREILDRVMAERPAGRASLRSPPYREYRE